MAVDGGYSFRHNIFCKFLTKIKPKITFKKIQCQKIRFLHEFEILVFVLLAILCSAFVVAIETLPDIQDHLELLSLVELSLNIWFLIELILRMSFCPNIYQFFCGYMNMIDIVAIIPYFIMLIVQGNIADDGVRSRTIQFFQILKFLRVFRLFRFSKQSKRLLVAGKVLKTCNEDFRVLTLCFFIMITLGGSLIYYAESNTGEWVGEGDGGRFESIPASFWWSIQTISTVGYGDQVPITLLGRLIACWFMLVGIAVMALPIFTIVLKFVAFISCKNSVFEI